MEINEDPEDCLDGVLEGPTPEQKAAAREVDRRMNCEEINESLEDRLVGVLEGPTPEQEAAAREVDRRMIYE